MMINKISQGQKVSTVLAPVSAAATIDFFDLFGSGAATPSMSYNL